MAACIKQAAPSSYMLEMTTITPEQCSAQGGYVVLSTTEYQEVSLHNWLNLPTAEDFAAAWQLGFILPMTLAMVAWAAAKIVSVWRN